MLLELFWQPCLGHSRNFELERTWNKKEGKEIKSKIFLERVPNNLGARLTDLLFFRKKEMWTWHWDIFVRIFLFVHFLGPLFLPCGCFQWNCSTLCGCMKNPSARKQERISLLPIHENVLEIYQYKLNRQSAIGLKKAIHSLCVPCSILKNIDDK